MNCLKLKELCTYSLSNLVKTAGISLHRLFTAGDSLDHLGGLSLDMCHFSFPFSATESPDWKDPSTVSPHPDSLYVGT